MENVKFAFNLYRIQLRMIFGGKHRYRKEYDEALDTLGERGHWLYLYDALEGPHGKQVCEALKKWVEAYQAKQVYDRSVSEMYEKQALLHTGEDQEKWNQVLWTEQRLKRELHVLIYGEFTEGVHGYV
jgi:hypothetical protein